jgi:hypothetical protein
MIVGFQNCAVQSDSALKHSGDIKIGLATPEASEEVKAAFVRILGRLPSSAELKEWTDAIDSGSTLEELIEELTRQALQGRN